MKSNVNMIKKFHMTENHLKLIFEHITEGVQIIDDQGRLLYCNQKAAMLDDINILESIGRHITEIYPSLKNEDSTLLNVLCDQTPIFNREQTFRTYKGKVVTTVNTTIPLIEEDVIFGAIEISNDITAYKILTEQYMALRRKVSVTKSKTTDVEISHFRFEDIHTHNSEFIRIKNVAMKAAVTDLPILIYGETGTGKEMMAQAIHSMSHRSSAPFIAQNCAALPGTLLEGILFGTVKGGFTDATDRPGLFELASGGTLFLDEINSMPLELQAKLLRALQDSKIRRIGDTKERKVDVRILTATNIEPNQAIEKGLLRRDLYYRLNTVLLWIPKLSDRPEDIMHLTRYFMDKFNGKLFKQYLGISAEVEKIFMQYPWEGNVRELEHVIEGAMHIGEGGIIELSDIPSYMISDAKRNSKFNEDGTMSLSDQLEKIESDIIREVFEKTNKNITQTAKKLGIPRQTLQYKLNKYEKK